MNNIPQSSPESKTTLSLQRTPRTTATYPGYIQANGLILCITTLLLLGPLQLSAWTFFQEELVIRSLPYPDRENGIAVVPWQPILENGDAIEPESNGNQLLNMKGQPLFLVTTPSNKGDKALEGVTIAQGWITANSNSLWLKVVVTDDQHINQNPPYDAWKGDALQIALDARGDATQGMPENTPGVFGPDDLALTLALTEEGPQCWVHFAGNSTLAGNAAPGKILFAVNRSDREPFTSYTLEIPWNLLETTPYVRPAIGLSIQVNDTDPATIDQSEDASNQSGESVVESGIQEIVKTLPQVRHYWGRGADGEPRPGMFNQLLLEEPEEAYIAAEFGNRYLWDSTSRANILLAIKGDETVRIFAQMEDTNTDLFASSPERISRYSVEASQSSFTESGWPLLVQVQDEENRRPILETAMPVIVPWQDYIALENRLNILIRQVKEDNNPLFLRHLQSVRSLVTTEMGRLMTYVASDPNRAIETARFIQELAKGFEGDAANWESYQSGRRALVMSYRSERDNVLQYYTLSIPENRDPEKAYPLLVELHGYGNDNPLFGVARYCGIPLDFDPSLNGFRAEHESFPAEAYIPPRTWAMIYRKGYHIAPFARGNTFYKGIGEIAVWEAIRDAHKRFQIDPDRRYLYGFSMGGGGTWAIGLRTPDFWAAIAVFAGGLWHENPGIDIGPNAAHLPVWLWCGENDHLMTQAQKMAEMLAYKEPAPSVRVASGLGHYYAMEAQQAGIEWMTQYQRKRPSSFAFKADSKWNTSCWGIELARDIAISPTPQFRCTIESDTVSIASEGTEQLIVDLGKTGLRLREYAEVVVNWNGKECYRGKPVKVKLSGSGTEVVDPGETQFRAFRNPLRRP